MVIFVMSAPSMDEVTVKTFKGKGLLTVYNV